MSSCAQIDFAGPHFAGHELRLGKELTILGRDLPEFRVWALQNGVSEVRHIADADRYLADNHEMVVHDFGRSITLSEIEELKVRIRMLMSKTERLLLFVDIADHCTIHGIRRVFQSELSDFTFRIVFPRQMFKTSGVTMILVQRRRARVFLFVGELPMSGKTESTLALGRISDATIVHGDDFLHGIASGNIAASAYLRHNVRGVLQAPFQQSLFAHFIALMPAFKNNKDIVFDFSLPRAVHNEVVEFFDELGFFPILCLTFPNRKNSLQSRLVESCDEFNFVSYNEQIYALHKKLGPLDVAVEADTLLDRFGPQAVIIAATIEEARARVEVGRLRGELHRLERDGIR